MARVIVDQDAADVWSSSIMPAILRNRVSLLNGQVALAEVVSHE